MADSYNKKERAKKKLKKRQDKADKKAQKKEEGIKGPEFLYMDKNGNFSPTPFEDDGSDDIDVNSINVSVPKKEDREEVDNGAHVGRVKFFDTEKGFGFINAIDGPMSYFVHIDGLNITIKEGDKVTFTPSQNAKGLCALDVKHYVKPEPKPTPEDKAKAKAEADAKAAGKDAPDAKAADAVKKDAPDADAKTAEAPAKDTPVKT